MIDVCAVIEREVGVPVTEVTPLDTLAIDSLEFLSLWLALTNETGKDIPASEMGSVSTVGDLVRVFA